MRENQQKSLTLNKLGFFHYICIQLEFFHYICIQLEFFINPKELPQVVIKKYELPY